MKKTINFIVVLITFLYIFNLRVDAECSYQERKELLNSAKNVSITVEPKIEIFETEGTNSFSEEVVTQKVEKYSFNFIVSNLSDDLYIRYYNDFNEEEKFISSSDLNDGLYSFNVDDASNLITYYFEIRSNNNNCAGQIFYNKKVIKPIYNYYSEYAICKEEIFKNKDYCKKFVTKKLNLTEEEFFNVVNKVSVGESEKSETATETTLTLLDIIKNYWYLGVGLILIIIIVVVVIAIKKKREKLI